MIPVVAHVPYLTGLKAVCVFERSVQLVAEENVRSRLQHALTTIWISYWSGFTVVSVDPRPRPCGFFSTIVLLPMTLHKSVKTVFLAWRSFEWCRQAKNKTAFPIKVKIAFFYFNIIYDVRATRSSNKSRKKSWPDSRKEEQDAASYFARDMEHCRGIKRGAHKRTKCALFWPVAWRA